MNKQIDTHTNLDENILRVGTTQTDEQTDRHTHTNLDKNNLRVGTTQTDEQTDRHIHQSR